MCVCMCVCVCVCSSMSAVSKDVVRFGLSALRQLTHSDHNKRLLAELHAPELLIKLTVSVYAQK